jgi:hypothetical protein
MKILSSLISITSATDSPLELDSMSFPCSPIPSADQVPFRLPLYGLLSTTSLPFDLIFDLKEPSAQSQS